MCEADYVRFTNRHLHQRVKEHKRSTIQNTVADKHGKDPKTIKRNFNILKKNFRVIIQNSPRLFYFHRAFTYISPPTQKRLFLWVAVLQIHFPYKMKAYEGISKEGSVAEWLRWWSSLQVFYPITNIQVHFQGDCLIWYNGHMLVVNSA